MNRAAFAILLLWFSLLARCQTVNMTGNWTISGQSDAYFFSFSATGNISQSGSALSGQLTVSGTPCASSVTFTGSLTGTSVTMNVNVGGQNVVYTGTVAADGNSASGTYTSPAGGCVAGDRGRWTARKVVPPVIALSQTSLTFTTQTGGTPASQVVAVSNSGGGTLSWSASISGATWLRVTPTFGTNSGNLTVSVVSSTLAVGSYSGTITVSATGAASRTISVSLTVTAVPPTISLTPASLQFTANQGSNPSPKTFQVLNSGSGSLGWNATVQSEGNWLSVSPTTGVAPTTLTVTVNSSSLALGTYPGRITITALASANASNSPQTIEVGLTVGAPVAYENGVVNGASFAPSTGVSPSSIASLFGVRLSAASAAAASLPLPTILAGTQVLVNNLAAPLFYVSPGQINFQVPAGLTGSSVPVSVVSNGVASAAIQAKLIPEMPGIFKAAAGDVVQGAVLNQDLSPNSATNPAASGSVVVIFATGLGATNPPLSTGQTGRTSAPFNDTVVRPTVLIGGATAELLFSAMAPGFVGLYQINARIPASTAQGSDVRLVLQANGQSSNPVTIAVRPPSTTPDFTISTLASGLNGLAGGMAFDAAGNLYTATWTTNRVVRVSPSGSISTFAGTTTQGSSGDGGSATAATFYWPMSVAVNGSGEVFIADTYNNKIRKVSNGTVSTIAGTGAAAFSGDGGPATQAALNRPRGLRVDAEGNLVFSDSFNRRIRKIASDGAITTLTQTSDILSDLAIDHSGNIYGVSLSGMKVVKWSPGGTVQTIAGTGAQGFSGDGGPATSAQFNNPQGIAVDAAGNVYVADTSNSRIRRITPDGVINTVAGNGTQAFSGDGGPAMNAATNQPQGVIVAPDGTLFISDSFNYRIRRLTPIF